MTKSSWLKKNLQTMSISQHNIRHGLLKRMATKQGNEYVQLHVVDDIEHFTDIDSLVSTVAATVCCGKSNIKVVGLHPESSFVIVLSMTKCLAQTLGRKGPQDLAGLLKYNVDWLKIDNRIIYITRGNEEKLEVPGRSTGESEDEENIEGQSINKESNQKTKGDYDLGLQKRVVVEENVDEIKSFLSGTCTNLFRKILRRYVPDEDFLTLIQKSKDQVLPLLNADQKNMLYPEKGSFSVSNNNLDLPLLYILFQTICFMEPHSRGWGKTPDPSDTSMAACIENIMEYFFNTPLCLEWSDFDRISKLFEQMEEALRNLEMKSVEKEIESRANKQREKRANEKMEGRPKEERDIFRKGMEIRVKDEMDIFEEKLSQKTKEGTDIFKMGLERGTKEKTEIFKKVMKRSTQEERDIFGKGMEIEDEIKTKERMSIFEKLMGKSAKEDFFKKGMEGRVKGKMERIEKEQILPGKFRDMSISQHLVPSVVRTSSITVPGVDKVDHISCVTPDRLWVSDHRRLLQVDSTGQVIQEMEIGFTYHLRGAHSVTEDGDLIFINDDKVQKMTLGRTITTLLKERESLFCIHSSRINGDILVGYDSRVMSGVFRCDWRGNHRIELGEYRIRYPIFITENKNGDIWVSDINRMAVVVMDKSGKHRFNYRGQPESYFYPRGICTDILGQVLVCNLFDSSVHLVDQDGQFLRLLLTEEHGLDFPVVLCVDDKLNLYVGEEDSNTITVYKYLQETEDSKSSIVEWK